MVAIFSNCRKTHTVTPVGLVDIYVFAVIHRKDQKSYWKRYKLAFSVLNVLSFAIDAEMMKPQHGFSFWHIIHVLRIFFQLFSPQKSSLWLLTVPLSFFSVLPFPLDCPWFLVLLILHPLLLYLYWGSSYVSCDVWVSTLVWIHAARYKEKYKLRDIEAYFYVKIRKIAGKQLHV